MKVFELSKSKMGKISINGKGYDFKPLRYSGGNDNVKGWIDIQVLENGKVIQVHSIPSEPETNRFKTGGSTYVLIKTAIVKDWGFGG